MSVTETEEKPVNVTDTTSSDAASAGSSPAEDSSEKKTRTTARKKASSKEEGAVAEEKPKRQRRVRSSAKTIEETPSEEAKKSTFKTGEKAESASKDASAEGTKAEESETDSSQKNQQRKQRSSKKSGTSQKNSSSQKNSHRRSRRQHGGSSRREPVVPQTNREDLEKLKVVELRAKAAELGVESKGLKKAELVEVVLGAAVKAEGFVETEGILDILSDGYGFLRTKGYLPSEGDVYVGLSTIRRNGLRKGDFITGQVRPPRDNEKYAALQRIDTVNGIALEELGKRVRFADLTPVFPDERLVLEHGKNTITARVIDLCAPIGKGQRGLIVSPPKAGKTTILKDIAAAITANNPEVHLMCLLVDERPEEVTDMKRSLKGGEVIFSTFDELPQHHTKVAEMVLARAQRLVEHGKDVVILLDSITRLARAYNMVVPASGKTLSGGFDPGAFHKPKKFFGAARKLEEGGSITILATALIETGSRMDEVIFEEFKGTGNMELHLDRKLSEKRIFPAISLNKSGTRREDLLMTQEELEAIWVMRRNLSGGSTQEVTEAIIDNLAHTKNNSDFIKVIKKVMMD